MPVFLALLLLAATAIAAKKPITIEDTLSTRPVRGAVIWAPDGKRFAYTESGKLWLYEVATGKRHEVIAWKSLEDAAIAPPSPELADWTNRRVSSQSVQWFSSGAQMLVSSHGDLFILDTANSRFNQLTHTADNEQDPKLSPDNARVSFRRGHELYVLEVATKTVTRLTHDGSDTLLNAELDWVYPEELDLGTAHWWSPDSRSIAYLQFDVSREPVFPQVSLLSTRGQLEPERYPKPGDPNADVRVGVVPATGGVTQWMDFGETRGNLLARVAWLSDSGRVAVEKMNRVQNRLDLLFADRTTGKSQVILHEEDPAWINVNDGPHFLKDGSGFLWSSERDGGFRHLFLYSLDGKLRNQLTRGEWEVTRVAAVDEKAGQVFYLSSETTPLDRQLYTVNFDGSNKRRLSQGDGTHAISAAPDASSYLDTRSSLASPPETTLHDENGKRIAVYRAADHAAETDFDIQPTEIRSFRTEDGTQLFGRLIKPAGFTEGKKYPVICMVYGGPHAQSVTNSWAGVNWDQALAQKGFVIWQVDNRGSAGRGHRWESQVYHNLGALELEDQKSGIEYLKTLGFADTSRMGLYGWSYGGYMTLYSLTHAPELFKAGVAGAPVTSWKNYDTIYTERYMGLPSENPEGYAKSAPLTSAGALQAKLLMIHNVEDDNVHFQNTLQMADALEKANRKFLMLIYPQKAHGVTGPVRKHLLESITGFFESNL
ncbi:MAG: DPP IV N-terminal domain-containing protein [Acidobacteriota bacterium]|nr:DPP IV N-terminal domain-containing protein [Acidobacteriota bacterium]